MGTFSRQSPCGAFVDVASVPHKHDEDQQLAAINCVDDADILDPKAVEPGELTAQRLDGSPGLGVGPRQLEACERVRHTSLDLRVKASKVTVCGRREGHRIAL